MDKNYRKLFAHLALSTAQIAEQAMELNHKNNDIEAEKNAEKMRDTFTNLYQRLADKSVNIFSLGRDDYAFLLVGATIVAAQIEKKIEQEKLGLQGYKIDIIPKLERIMNETKTKEEANKLSLELFKVKENS